MFSWAFQNLQAPLSFKSFLIVKHNTSTQNTCTGFVCNYFLAFILLLPKYQSQLLYINVITQYFVSDVFILILCFQLSYMMLDIVVFIHLTS